MTELHTLIVSSKPETVAVYQKSKSVWVARVPYMGKPIRVEYRSEAAALERWQAAAEDEVAPRKAAVRKKAAGKATARKMRNKGKPRRRKS